MINLEYIRTLKSLLADFIREKQPEDVFCYQQVWDWLDSFLTESEHPKLRDKESWVSRAKREKDCEDIILEEKVRCLKEIRAVKDRYKSASPELDAEIDRYLRDVCSADDEPSVTEIARHFYELGKNARKEE